MKPTTYEWYNDPKTGRECMCIFLGNPMKELPTNDINFAGIEKRSRTGDIVNGQGNRNFRIVITDQAFADSAVQRGWKLRWSDYYEAYVMKVNVKFTQDGAFRDPVIQYWPNPNSNRFITLNAVTAPGYLDDGGLACCQIIISPYDKKHPGEITPYLNSMCAEAAPTPMMTGYFGDKMNEDDGVESLPFE